VAAAGSAVLSETRRRADSPRALPPLARPPGGDDADRPVLTAVAPAAALLAGRTPNDVGGAPSVTPMRPRLKHEGGGGGGGGPGAGGHGRSAARHGPGPGSGCCCCC